MKKTAKQLDKEIAEALAKGGQSRRLTPHISGMPAPSGIEAYDNILGEKRQIDSLANMSDLALDVSAQHSPHAAHQLVGVSEGHAAQATRIFDYSRAWVTQARGTSQAAAVAKVFAEVQRAVKRAQANAVATKRAFEKRFGKYDPRGVSDLNNPLRSHAVQRGALKGLQAKGESSSQEDSGTAVYNNIQEEKRRIDREMQLADNAETITAQRSPRAAHQLVEESAEHADQAHRLFEHAQGWVHKAQGTSQARAVAKVCAEARRSVEQARAYAVEAMRAFEKRFGKYDPRGVSDLNNPLRSHAVKRGASKGGPSARGQSRLSTKKAIADRAVAGLALHGQEVVSVDRKRGAVKIKHAWRANEDGRVLEAVYRAARVLAQNLADELGKSVEVYSAQGNVLDQVRPRG